MEVISNLKSLSGCVHIQYREVEKHLAVKSDMENLVDKYFGGLYKNYEHSKKCLIRQARDLLVCEYHGCLQRFEDEFCIQAGKLLQHIKVRLQTLPL
ncbi:hypothetical protein JTB14_008388 [Gonioctena quinquepunctata]|nr:hypothetical protein JTB14_008388 [Gonioctena quinquepunctata]